MFVLQLYRLRKTLQKKNRNNLANHETRCHGCGKTLCKVHLRTEYGQRKLEFLYLHYLPFGNGINGGEFGEVMLDEPERCFPSAENYLVWKGRLTTHLHF